MGAHYVEGNVVLEVENPEVACADEDLAMALKLAKAELAESSVDDVEVSCSVVPENARRLGSGSRRLAGSISFAYKIRMASAAEASAIATRISSETEEDFANLIQSHLPEGHSYNVRVLSMDATAVVVIITTTATTTEEVEEIDSHARSSAVLGPVAMAVIAASLVFSQ